LIDYTPRINTQAPIYRSFAGVIIIRQSEKLFGPDYLKPASLPGSARRFPLEHPVENVSDVVSFFRSSEKEAGVFIEKSEGVTRVIYTQDMIADAFFMLSRYEEVVHAKHSGYDTPHDRFPASMSLAFKEGFLKRPVVNEYLEILFFMLRLFDPGIEKRDLWGGREFALHLSHDVDFIAKYQKPFWSGLVQSLRDGLYLAKENKDLSFAPLSVKEFCSARKDYHCDPFWSFGDLCRTEDHYGFLSSFYFIASGRTDYEQHYVLDDSRVQKLIQILAGQGREIGCHGSYESFRDEMMLKKEKALIDKQIAGKAAGVRQHYLRFQASETWCIQDRCGFLYDATLGYPEACGFRSGFCLPYHPYDFEENRALSLWEIPLIVMDGTLRDPKYGGYSPQEGLSEIKELAGQVKQFNGVFSFLWHNSSFGLTWRHWEKVYEEALSYLSLNNAAGFTGSELIQAIEKKTD